MARLLRILIVSALAAMGLLAVAPTSEAATSTLVVDSFGPREGAAVVVGKVAANDPTAPPTWQLNLDLNLENHGRAPVILTKVALSYPGDTPTDPSPDIYNATFESLQVRRVQIYDGRTRDLAFSALPTSVTVTVSSKTVGGTVLDDKVFTFPLVGRPNTVPGGALFFPARFSDMGSGKYLIFNKRHYYDDNSGRPSCCDQRWGYDIGLVVRRDGAWVETIPGTEPNRDDQSNTDYYLWNFPLYAMGDGTVVGCFRGDPDHDPVNSLSQLEQGVDFENYAGNALTIRYGNDVVTLGHFKAGSIPTSLCPETGRNRGLDIPVSLGTKLGVLGNSGNTSNPHFHIHATQWTGDISDVDAGGGSGIPLQFRNLRSIADDSSLANLEPTDTLRPHHGLVLHRHSLFRPNTCGLVPGTQVPNVGANVYLAKGVSEDCVQDRFNIATARGLRLVGVDAWTHGSGATYFNMIFRKAPINAWEARIGLTAAEADALIVSRRLGGWRVHAMETYLSGGAQRFAVIFEKRPGAEWAVATDEDQTTWDATWHARAEDGYVLVNVSAVQVSGQTRYSALFEKVAVNGWTWYVEPAADVDERIVDEQADGRSMIYANGTTLGGSSYVLSVFAGVGGSTGTTIARGIAFDDADKANTRAGRAIRTFTGYADGVTSQWIGIWRAASVPAITSGPSGSGPSTSATLEFAPTDPFAIGSQCSLNSLTVFATCTSPKSYVQLAPGVKTFRVRSLDRDGVTSATTSRSWKVTERPRLTSVDPDVIARGTTTKVVILGSGFTDSTQVTFGREGVRATEVEHRSASKLVVTVKVRGDTALGWTSIRLTNADGGTTLTPDAIKIRD